MAQDPNLINPLTNPIFFPIVYKFILVFALGLILIFLLNKFKFKKIWKTNLGQRYLSWLVLGIIYFIAIFFGGYTSLFFLLLLMFLAIQEVGKISKIPRVYISSLYFLAIISVYISSFQPINFYTLPLLYFIVLGIFAINQNDKKGLFHYSLSLFISIWIIFALSHLVLLGHLNNDLDSTKSLLILIGFAVAFSDIGAYILGKGFSKTKLNKFKIADKISPNKTYVGVLGNIIGAGLGIWLMYFVIKSYFSIPQLVYLAILIGLFAVVGDITESLFKRYFSKKESGSLLPGHGGILDRIDSLLSVIIAVYYFTLIVIPVTSPL